MVRMSSERETVISIRHQVDKCVRTEPVQTHNSVNQLHLVSGVGNTQSPRIILGSWDQYRDVGGYEDEVLEEFGFVNFAERLATFLQRFGFNVHGKDFNPDAGHGMHVKRMRVCSVLFQLSSCSMLSVAPASTLMHHPVYLSRDGHCQD